jgi:hypothetical protein
MLSTVDEIGAGASWLSVVGGILSMAVVVTYFGKFVYLKRFALRIPDASAVSTSRVSRLTIAAVTLWIS